MFLYFTISQVGMVLRWRQLQLPGWRVKAFVNGVGALATLIVLRVIACLRFLSGAWLVVVLIPVLVLVFLRIHAHDTSVKQQLAVMSPAKALDTRPQTHAVLVLVPGVTRGTIEAVEYARSLAGDCRAIHVETNPENTPALRDAWLEYCHDIPLVILEAPYRTVVEPLTAYLDEVQRETSNTRVTVVIAEFVAPRWWPNLLHGHAGVVLKLAILNRRNVVLTNVRYHLKDEKLSLQDLLDIEQDNAGYV